MKMASPKNEKWWNESARLKAKNKRRSQKRAAEKPWKTLQDKTNKKEKK